MPIKKIATNDTSAVEKSGASSTKMIFGIIITILVLFAGNVLYETVTDVHQKFAVTETESKSCLVDFQT